MLKEKDVIKLIDAAIAKERRRAARQLSDYIKDRFQSSHPHNAELSTFKDRSLTYWDMVMVAKQMAFKKIIGTNELPPK